MTYWTTNGRSRPSSARALSIASGLSAMPVFSIFWSTASLPASLIIAKDRNVITSRMGTSWASLRMT